MFENHVIDVIIPAYNEEDSISKVIGDIPKKIVRHIVVGNNNSTDDTGKEAEKAGAKVIFIKEKGYGITCLECIKYVCSFPKSPDIIVFMDGDYADFPQQLPEVIKPIIVANYDMVIGSRVLGKKEKGSMTFPQIFGNKLAVFLIRLLYGYTYTDLGPFRAITNCALMKLKMQDRNFGWTVEMQIKAAQHKLKVIDVPVNYKRRIGASKVSGTIKGTLMASYKILWTIFTSMTYRRK